MEWSIRTLDRGELPGFRPYLLPETARGLERRADGLLVLGAVTGRSACGAAAVRRSGTSPELTDLFVDASVRRRGAGRALLEELIRRLEAEGAARLSADYVLRGEELAAMDHLLDTCGFSAPQRRSRVFQVPSERFHDDPRLGAAFSPQYRTPLGVCALGEVSAAALEELETAEDIPEHLAWASLRDRALPELSVGMLREGRVAAYLLAEEGGGGCVLLSAVRRAAAPPTAFQSLLLELLNRSWYRFGGDFPFYFSALTPKVERLALLLMGDRYEDYEEHTCARKLISQAGPRKEEGPL